MTIWQQLGGKVYTGENLTDDQIRRFQQAGGKWICPWVYQDLNADSNLARIPHWRALGVTVGGVFNCFGTRPGVDDATAIAAIATQHSITLVVLDLEAAYQYPNPGCEQMPPLLAKLRELLPRADIAVNTNGLNDSMIWNGGPDYPSCFQLGIRVCPQWYSAPRYGDNTWTDPVKNMTWLQANGAKDNFYEPAQAHQRAVPFSYIHPCVEPTGVEDAVLATTIDGMLQAQPLGLTTGFNLFVLERVPESDFQLVEGVRGKLYLG